MKTFSVIIIFACLAFPVFSQTGNVQQFRSLSDSMETTISRSNSKLANFDQYIAEFGSAKNYGAYREKYEILSKALQESEARLNMLIRTNDRVALVREERDNYEKLIRQLETVKSEYDSWLRTVQ